MEKLWAPWRMVYIREQVDKDEGCFLCRLAESEPSRENLMLWRSQHCLCVLNRFPYSNGHLLIAPLRHEDDVARLTDEELLELMRQVGRMKNLLQGQMSAQGFNIGLNVGRIAGAGVEEHLHMHIVPRWSGDTNYMPVIADVKIIPQALEDIWEQLRQAMKQADPESATRS